MWKRTTGSPGALLLGGAALLGLAAAVIALTGGVDLHVGGVPLRARSWERPGYLALAVATVALFLLRRPILAALHRSDPAAAAERAVPWLAWCAVGWAAAAGLAFGTHTAGGSDSYGYVSQAELFAQGRLTDRVPVDPAFRWPDVAATLTPLGFVPGDAGRIVPQYPPGLPLLMAPLAFLHRAAAFLVVPMFGALAVWACWRLGHRMGDPVAGALAAVLLAASPTFMYQVVQPMSDVPVAACWLAALLLARGTSRGSAAAAGALGGLAVLIRPNLAPLLVLLTAAAATAGARMDVPRAVRCAAAALPALAILAAIQQARYGSPLASGYGAFGDLFSPAHVAPNLQRYPRWLVETHGWFIGVWLAAPAWIARQDPPARSMGWIACAFCVAVPGAYLPYVYFQPHEWFYTRFLLPAIPLMLLLGAIPAAAALRWLSPRWGTALALALAILLSGAYARNSVRAGALDLREAERKYPAAGVFVRDHLPANAIILARQHSGSVRYYAGRPILRWDVLDRGSLDRAVSDLRRAGYAPFAVLDPDEYQEFRERFGNGDGLASRLLLVATVERTRILGFAHPEETGGGPSGRQPPGTPGR